MFEKQIHYSSKYLSLQFIFDIFEIHFVFEFFNFEHNYTDQVVFIERKLFLR